MNQLASLLHFVVVLENNKIWHRLSSVRGEAVMVEIATPGDRWEVEFFADGHIEVEQFRSTGDVLESSIDDLMKRIVANN